MRRARLGRNWGTAATLATVILSLMVMSSLGLERTGSPSLAAPLGLGGPHSTHQAALPASPSLSLISRPSAPTTVSVVFTSTIPLYAQLPLPLAWTISTNGVVGPTTTKMYLVIYDLGSTACPAKLNPPCLVTNTSLTSKIVAGVTAYAMSLNDSNMTVSRYNGRILPFDTEYSIAVIVSVNNTGVIGWGGASQNVYVIPYGHRPMASLVSPSTASAAPTGNITVVVNYQGDFVAGAQINIYSGTGTTGALVYTAGVATVGTGVRTGWAQAPWRATTPGTYTALVNLSGAFGSSTFTSSFRVVPSGGTVYVNSTSYQNRSLIPGLNQGATGAILLLIGLAIGLVVALMLGRMMWAGTKPSSPQPWTSTKTNECAVCHQSFPSETELKEHTKTAHGIT